MILDKPCFLLVLCGFWNAGKVLESLLVAVEILHSSPLSDLETGNTKHIDTAFVFSKGGLRFDFRVIRRN